MKVVVLGGTGFVGRGLVKLLSQRGDHVVVASRSPAKARATMPAGVATCGEDDAELGAAFSGARAVVNLAGENLFAGRWTKAKKERIRASRVDTTHRVVAILRGLDEKARPAVLVNASAIGYYGSAGEADLTESSPAGDDFLADVCRSWEAAASEAESAGVRVVRARSGVVLGRGGGALATMELPFRLFAGGPPGSGRQWVSWIHVDDEAALMARVLDDEAVRGPVNLTAPAPVRMEHLCRALGVALRRPSWLRVPEPMLRLAFGEKADALLASVRALPCKALDARFSFRHETVAEALAEIYGRGSSTNAAA